MSSRDSHRSSSRGRGGRGGRGGGGGRSDSYDRYDDDYDYYSDRRRGGDSGRGYDSSRAGGSSSSRSRRDDARRSTYDYYDDYDRSSRDDRRGRDRSYSRDYSSRGRDDDYYYDDRDRDHDRHDCSDGKYRSSTSGKHHSSRRRERKDYSDEEEGEHKRPKLSATTSTRTWPPPFDQDGALYLFDARSGFFYEAESDFFYDPKTKLYYSNKKATYFQYCQGENPPYRAASASYQQQTQQQQHHHGEQQKAAEVSAKIVQSSGVQPDITNGKQQQEISTTTEPTAKLDKAAPGSKMKIAISLKTKMPLVGGSVASRPSAGSSTPAASSKGRAATVGSTQESSRVKKTHAADMAKWSDIQRQKKDKASSNGTTAAKAPSGSQSTPTTTKKGEPMCLLCRRKFATLEKLTQHEQVSALHKQNLAKKNAAGAEGIKQKPSPSKNTPSTEYRDRAKDRRTMYGPDLGAPPPHKAAAVAAPLEVGPSLEKARKVAATVTVRPDETLGDSNIGSKMLKKLGWKKGASLGRKQSLEASGSDTNTNLKRDWEKIESAAQNPRATMGHQGGVGGEARR